MGGGGKVTHVECRIIIIIIINRINKRPVFAGVLHHTKIKAFKRKERLYE